MGRIPADSTAYTTMGYSHYPPAPSFAVSPMIRRSAWRCNPYWTLSIFPVTTKLTLTYKSTDCPTDLYIATRARTVASVLSSILTTTTHRLQDFRRFW